jgi:hypothetical protein
MFCHKCGGAVPDSASFCPHCSAPIVAVQGIAPPPPPAGALPASAIPAAVSPQFVPQTDDKAVISLVLGILSMVSFSILTGIPAIILGKAARERIRASGGQLAGEGMATAGIVLGWISVGLAVVVVIVFVLMMLYLMPNFH